MTKKVTENFNGKDISELDAVELTMTDRAEGKLVKVVFDMSRADWLKMYKAFVEKPPYQYWIKATQEAKQKDPNAKGYWAIMEQNGHA
jgi:hypothetical protein